MRLELTGRHLAITPAMRALVEARLEYTLKRLNDHAVSAHVVLTRERARIHAEVTLHARRERFLHAEATGQNVELAINAAAGQGRSPGAEAERKARWPEAPRAIGGQGRGAGSRGGDCSPIGAAAAPPHHSRAAIRGEADVGRRRGCRNRRRRGWIDRVSNSATDTVTVLFRRADGNLGLIEPEA
jgi:ribosomal subunit interface protein